MYILDLLKVVSDSVDEVVRNSSFLGDVRVVLDTGSPESDFGIVYDIEHAQLRYNKERGDYILVLYGNE